MRWIAAFLLTLTLAAQATATEQRPNPQAAWRHEVSRALAGATGQPEFKVVRTKKQQVLLVSFRVDQTGKMQRLQVKNIRDSTYQARAAVKKVFSEVRFPSPPTGDRPHKFSVPVVIGPELTREDMIEQLESRSKALADMAEKLKRQQ